MKTKIDTLILEARKSRNTPHLAAYQYVKSAIQTTEGRDTVLPDGKVVPTVLSDVDVLKVIEKEIKSLNEMIENKIAHNNESEMVTVLLKLLPAKVEVSQYDSIVTTAITTVGATTPKDMGKVMAEIKKVYGSTVDNKVISDVVKSKLK